MASPPCEGVLTLVLGIGITWLDTCPRAMARGNRVYEVSCEVSTTRGVSENYLRLRSRWELYAAELKTFRKRFIRRTNLLHFASSK